jgi:hypothetical protein
MDWIRSRSTVSLKAHGKRHTKHFEDCFIQDWNAVNANDTIQVPRETPSSSTKDPTQECAGTVADFMAIERRPQLANLREV